MADNEVHLLLRKGQAVWDVVHNFTGVVPWHGTILKVFSMSRSLTQVSRNSRARDPVSAGQRDAMTAAIALLLNSSTGQPRWAVDHVRPRRNLNRRGALSLGAYP